MDNILIKIWRWLLDFFKKKSVQEIQQPEVKINLPEVEIQIKDFYYEFIDDIPESIEKHKIYIVGESNFHWVLVFICPCGCEESIQLNLLEDTSPSWRYFIDENINIKPSIWRNTGCKSHFFINDGEVKWVYEEEDD